MNSIIEKLPSGKLVLNETVVFSCGCGDLMPDTRNKLRMAGVDVPIITTTASRRAKDYIRQVGLNYAVPSLNKNSHSVLYNPATGQYIDLRKSPQNKQVYENIFNVVNGL